MVQIVKHLGLIIALVTWLVFPLPECYLTKPDCPKRSSPLACQAMNHKQPTAQADGAQACCQQALPGSGEQSTAKPQASNQDGDGMLVVSLSPRFLLPDPPELSGPELGLSLPLSVSTASVAVRGNLSPYRGERTDPVPLLLKTQTLLI